jgi:hypothetical protein
MDYTSELLLYPVTHRNHPIITISLSWQQTGNHPLVTHPIPNSFYTALCHLLVIELYGLHLRVSITSSYVVATTLQSLSWQQMGNHPLSPTQFPALFTLHYIISLSLNLMDHLRAPITLLQPPYNHMFSLSWQQMGNHPLVTHPTPSPFYTVLCHLLVIESYGSPQNSHYIVATIL